MSKTAIITGAGSGLGRALARKLGAEGYRLVLLGRTLSKVQAVAAELGDSAMAIACDVGDAQSVRTAFETIAERHPTVDVLIANAGVYELTFVKDATDQQISDALMTNLAGPIYCARAVIPMLRKGGQIVTISSETVTSQHAMFSLYQSSKAGLERFTEALLGELAVDGIRVTMVRAGAMSGPDSRPLASPELRQMYLDENLRRGVTLGGRPVSSFESAAQAIAAVLALPPDIQVKQIALDGFKV